MRIGIIGYGGVGKALIRLFEDKKYDFERYCFNPKIIFILKSNGGIYDPEGIDCKKLIKFTEKEGDITLYSKGGSRNLYFEKLIKVADIDLLIELTPTNIKDGEPALTYISEALNRGIHVVTGNKGPILLAYRKLKELAKKNGVQLFIGCTTGGALPTIYAGSIDLAGANIVSIEGILNGTTNFILQEMEERQISFEEALKTAQELGIAEKDPYLDIEGWDTATKLLILTNALMATDIKLSDIQVNGISNITLTDIKGAKCKGEKFKLIGRSEVIENKIEVSVNLVKIGKDHPLYHVDGRNKGVRYTSDSLGDLTVLGGASGVTSAAASILRDIILLHRGYKFL